ISFQIQAHCWDVHHRRSGPIRRRRRSPEPRTSIIASRSAVRDASRAAVHPFRFELCRGLPGMIFAMAAFAPAPNLLSMRQAGCLYKPSWDLSLLIFSAVLVPLPFLVAWGAQISGWMNPGQAIDAVNITVALLIGGPHLFSTISYTFLDSNFRR